MRLRERPRRCKCCFGRAHVLVAPRLLVAVPTLFFHRRLQNDFAEARDAFEAHAAEQAARIGELEEMYRDRPSREEDVDRMR